jgi:hypothetical protein
VPAEKSKAERGIREVGARKGEPANGLHPFLPVGTQVDPTPAWVPGIWRLDRYYFYPKKAESMARVNQARVFSF